MQVEKGDVRTAFVSPWGRRMLGGPSGCVRRVELLCVRSYRHHFAKDWHAHPSSLKMVPIFPNMSSYQPCALRRRAHLDLGPPADAAVHDVQRGALQQKSCQVGPKDASGTMHSCGNTAVEGCSWPNFWANSASFSLATLIKPSDLSLVGSMEALWWY